VISESLQWLQGTALAVAVSEKWFPYIESVHVITMALVAGTLFMVDTRLMGVTSNGVAFSYLSERLLPWTWWAFAGSVLTGALMFMGNATGYYDNACFRWKMSLMLLAGINMLFFQTVTFRGVAAWDSARPPLAARTAGILSIVLWSGVIGFGRWIGFTS
jgi:hypothetical protein